MKQLFYFVRWLDLQEHGLCWFEINKWPLLNWLVQLLQHQLYQNWGVYFTDSGGFFYQLAPMDEALSYCSCDWLKLKQTNIFLKCLPFPKQFLKVPLHMFLVLQVILPRPFQASVKKSTKINHSCINYLNVPRYRIFGCSKITIHP